METLLTVIIILLKIIVLLAPLLLAVAYLTYAERKVIGYMQVRLGPNRVGPKGWLQPIADAMKLMFKEIIIPTRRIAFCSCWRRCCPSDRRSRPGRSCPSATA